MRLMRRRGIGLSSLGLGMAAIFCLGCNSGSGPKTAAREKTERDVQVVHEDCDVASQSAEKLDANSDGKADVTIVKDGSQEVCRAVDLNLDGRVDVWSYSDGSGKLRRREYDFDRNGTIDQIVTYQAGVPVHGERATLMANRLDTWDYYQNGALARTERDSDSDAHVDQWWEYPKAGCPLIHTDTNSDGMPDPGSTVDYCKETGYVPPDRQYYRQAEGANFKGETSTPTEVGNEPAEASPPPAPVENKGGK
jgi:hypothetical protein